MPSASCCFIHVFYIAENQHQTESKCSKTFWRIFLDQKEQHEPKKYQRGAPRGARPTWARLGGHNPPGHAWAPRHALVGAAPLEAPPGASLAHWLSSGPKKSPKSYAVFGLCLILISCDVKNKQKTATGTRHYVNRLVPKNDIKLL